MQYLTVQNIDIPVVYVSGLSYSKQARLASNSRGFSRFRGFEPAEISLRIHISKPLADVCERDYMADIRSILSIEPVKDSDPTQFIYAQHILYPSLMFRITSMTWTAQADINGNIYDFEADLSLSGVECVKGEVNRRALRFTAEEQIELPDIEITCKGASYQIGNDSAVASFVLRPESAEIEVILGTDLTIIKDTPWLNDLVENEATLEISGYGAFYIVESNLVDGFLSLRGSKWPKQHEKTETYQDTDLSTILKSLAPQAGVHVSGQISHYLRRGGALSSIMDIQASAGFIVDFGANTPQFRPVPDYITPAVDFDLYVDEDIATEMITGLVWADGEHEVIAGSNPSIKVDSVFSSTSAKHAANCLAFAQYMQNSIRVEIPIDERIRHHSAMNIIKNDKKIACMVEDYVIDFALGVMTLDLHYLER